MYRIRKQFKFECAHRLAEAYSKCCTDSIHGHSYIVEIFVISEILDPTNMVVDFGELKDIIGPQIDAWDHAVIMPANYIEGSKDLALLGNSVVVVEENPTAEWMAKKIFDVVKQGLEGKNVRVEKARVHETVTGWAEYEE